jgi:hypothetical protein
MSEDTAEVRDLLLALASRVDREDDAVIEVLLHHKSKFYLSFEEFD